MLGKEVALRKGTIIRLDNHPGQVYFDVDLADSLPSQYCFKFQNFYTATIMITQMINNSFKNIAEPLVLMQNPYVETDSQRWFTLPNSQFNASFRKDQTIRIFLFQPSPQWAKYEIRNLQLFELTPAPPTPLPSSATPSLFLFKQVALDWQVLTQQASLQMNMKTPIYSGTNVDVAKRAIKRKDRRRRQAATSSNAVEPPIPPSGIMG